MQVAATKMTTVKRRHRQAVLRGASAAAVRGLFERSREQIGNAKPLCGVCEILAIDRIPLRQENL